MAVFIYLCFLFPRRKKDDNVTFDTFCHNPDQKVYGLVLEDYNNRKCEMKERKGMGSQFFICACSEEECNDHIFFNSRKLRHNYFTFLYFQPLLRLVSFFFNQCIFVDCAFKII